MIMHVRTIHIHIAIYNFYRYKAFLCAPCTIVSCASDSGPYPRRLAIDIDTLTPTEGE